VPIYDYICNNAHRLEVIHGVHDEGPAICPQCGGPLRRALSAPAIHFRGTGWAKKDRSVTSAPAKKPAAGEAAAAPPATKTEGSGADKSE
jgi:putative FmdB family regulatory protein